MSYSAWQADLYRETAVFVDKILKGAKPADLLVDPKIAEHHGRIVKNTGHGLLAEFPSVVDADRCAVAVQQAMPERNTGVAAESRIELRIGINLRDVIVEGDDLYGDGVNIAARIEALADAGGVFASNTVYDHVRDRLPFAFEDLGEQQVKNIARPVRVYRVRNAAANRPSTPMLPLPDKPSIAVPPFQNMFGDPEQEYFADGMVEEIITALSRIRWLFVIARNSSFTASRQGRFRPAETRRAGGYHQGQSAGRSARSRIAGNLRHRRAHGAKASPCRHLHGRPALERDAFPAAPGVGRHQRAPVPSDASRRRYPAPLLPLFQKHRPSACAGAGPAHQ
jgi:Adenylate and Guanylate cyclase catalytic domain